MIRAAIVLFNDAGEVEHFDFIPRHGVVVCESETCAALRAITRASLHALAVKEGRGGAL